MQNTQTFEKFEITVTLSRYGLFNGIMEPDGLNEDATEANFAAATERGLRAYYPSASLDVSYQCDATTATSVSVEGGTTDENEELDLAVTETLETVELFDFSDENLWVYDTPAVAGVVAN